MTATGGERSMNQAGIWRHLLAELRRRNVFRVATLYVIVLWPLIQLADIMQPVLGYSDVVMRVLVYAFIGGFPPALTLAWIYDITREGIVRTNARPDGDTETPRRALFGRGTEAAIIAVLALLVLALFLVQRSLDSPAVSDPLDTAATELRQAATSLAVLPFVSFSNSEDDQVFADGLTEELLNVLSRQPQLRIAARTSSFAYRGVNRNVQEVGGELGVGTILEGSVRRSDVSDTIRITAQLVDVASGAHLWSQTFDRQYRDVLRIQDDIAAAVAQRLSVTLLGGSGDTPARSAPESHEAFMLVSRARAALAKRSPASIGSAVEMLERATALSPDWAEAHALLAQAHVLMALYANADRQQQLQQAQQAVDRALALDPELGAAWAAQGLVHMQHSGQRQQSIEALQRAIALNPSYAMAHMWLGTLQDSPGQRLVHHRVALELDPRSAVAAYNVANDYLELGDEASAMQTFDAIVNADPFYPGAYKLTAMLNERHGRLVDAIVDMRRAWDLEAEPQTALQLALLHLSLADYPGARRWLAAAGDTANGSHEIVALWISALLAHADGATDRAKALITRIAERAGDDIHGNLDRAHALGIAGEHQRALTAFAAAASMARASNTTLLYASTVDALLGIAHSQRMLGRRAEADELITEVRGFLDTLLQQPGRAKPAMWYQRARLHLLENDASMALLLLQRAIDEGWTEHWRLALDPLFGTLANDERFVAIQRTLLARIAIMREDLQGLEQSGESGQP
jgi:TolB-like protein